MSFALLLMAGTSQGEIRIVKQTPHAVVAAAIRKLCAGRGLVRAAVWNAFPVAVIVPTLCSLDIL